LSFNLPLFQQERDAMKQLSARLLVIAALGVLLATAGCIMNQSDLVVTDEICANITEHETTGSFSTFTVVDDFKAQLEKALEKAGKKSTDVKSIHMISATFATQAVSPQDARATATIDIARQDNPGGGYDDGPAAFVTFNNTLLKSPDGQADRCADGRRRRCARRSRPGRALEWRGSSPGPDRQ
jgi:hypothetical protein